MIATITRSLLVALVLIWIALAWHGALNPFAALVAVIVGFLIIKFLITLGGFCVAAFANRDDPVGFRLHPMRLLYGFVEESWSTTRGLVELMPWRVAQSVARPEKPIAHRLPVLMIHGFVCNRGYWVPAARQLAQRGTIVDCVTLEPAFGNIDDYVAVVDNAIDALLRETGKPQVVLVCHSMGGLAARAYLRAKGDARVRHVITLGTPHHGTVIAQLGLGQNARQMERDNAWREALFASESPMLYTKFTTLYSRIDNIVAPARTAVLPNAKEIELDDVGHVAMSLAPRCLNVLFEEIERVNRV